MLGARAQIQYPYEKHKEAYGFWINEAAREYKRKKFSCWLLDNGNIIIICHSANQGIGQRINQCLLAETSFS